MNILVPLTKRYQWRRLKYANLTDDGRQTMSTPHIAIDRVIILVSGWSISKDLLL
jgi:hypothetical protein